MDDLNHVMSQIQAKPPLAVEIDRLRAERDMLAVLYDKALSDPAVRIPTYLHAALEALRK